MRYLTFLLLLLTVACRQQPKTVISPWTTYDESTELAASAKHESPKLRYKLIQSKILDKNDIWKCIAGQIADFSEKDYQELSPFILDRDINSIQSHIRSGELTYERLTQWYLYRIVKFENDPEKFLNAIVAINPNAVAEARESDKNKTAADHPIYGMPILLKDNIDAEGMPTTAGAVALKNNRAPDAFIVERIKEKGAVILGKTNLSEWANYLCLSCPNGYSAVGGQTLNPYGRKIFDTGGSSSGSAVAMAANYAAAAVGTETSGSITSPSSANSVVGLKPTVGLLSRSGIVPISSTLDTPGPITRNISDNALLLSAMSGEDSADPATKDIPKNKKYWEDLSAYSLKGVRLGIIKDYLKDSVYRQAVGKIVEMGGIAVEFEPEQSKLEGFGTLLNADMKIDLADYLNKYASQEVPFRSVSDISDFNKQDSLVKIPYGQARFEGILNEKISGDEHAALKNRLHQEGVSFFEIPMVKYQLDVILSVNNRNAGFAAAAKYPCLTIPMGYRKSGEPAGLTLITRPYQEDKLLKIGYGFEQGTKMRQPLRQ